MSFSVLSVFEYFQFLFGATFFQTLCRLDNDIWKKCIRSTSFKNKATRKVLHPSLQTLAIFVKIYNHKKLIHVVLNSNRQARLQAL